MSASTRSSRVAASRIVRARSSSSDGSIRPMAPSCSRIRAAEARIRSRCGRPRLDDRLHHHAEARHALARLGREVGAAVERDPVGVEEGGQRPAAVAGHPLHGLHVDRVDVGPLLAVDLDRDEVLVHVRARSRGPRTTRAPSRGTSGRPSSRSRAGSAGPLAGALERLGAPRVPVDRVVLVLEEVGAGLAARRLAIGFRLPARLRKHGRHPRTSAGRPLRAAARAPHGPGEDRRPRRGLSSGVTPTQGDRRTSGGRVARARATLRTSRARPVTTSSPGASRMIPYSARPTGESLSDSRSEARRALAAERRNSSAAGSPHSSRIASRPSTTATATQGVSSPRRRLGGSLELACEARGTASRVCSGRRVGDADDPRHVGVGRARPLPGVRPRLM